MAFPEEALQFPLSPQKLVNIAKTEIDVKNINELSSHINIKPILKQIIRKEFTYIPLLQYHI
jgi:hypothetical protein